MTYAKHPNVREVEMDLERREAYRQEREDAFTAEEGAKRFDAWLDSMRQKFLTEAREDFRDTHPPYTFEASADLYLRREYPDADARAQRIAYLVTEREREAKREASS